MLGRRIGKPVSRSSDITGGYITITTGGRTSCVRMSSPGVGVVYGVATQKLSRCLSHLVHTIMKKFSALAAIVLALSGCASVRNQPMDQKAAAAIKGQPVTYTTRVERPSFTAMTAGKAAFAILGAAAMISEGNDIISSNNVPDPADAIASGLAQALQTSHGATLSPAVNVVGNDLGNLVAKAGAAKYVVDVETVQWMFAYFPTDWSHYYVMYAAKARLIDTATKDVVAEGLCTQSTKDNPGAPSYDELVGNGAKRLKSVLADAASACVQQFKRDTFKL